MKAEIKPRFNFEGRTKLETVIPLSTPYLVFLDPSDKCNSKCLWCPTGSGEAKKYKKPQLMDFDLYKKIIDDLCDMPECIKTLRLYSDGEPLLNPRFADMVRLAKETGCFGQVDSTTNGILLNEGLSCELIDSGLDKIFISVPQDYNLQYRCKVAFFYGYGRKTCQVYAKIIGDGLSAGKKKKFMVDFEEISDRIFIENRINCWPNFDTGKNPQVGIYGNPLTDIKVCPYPLYSVKINSDGKVSLCFLDYPHQMIIGDLTRERFHDVWAGEKLKEYRIMHLKGLRKKHPFCGNCHQLTHGSPDDIDAYAKELLEKMK